MGGAGVAAVTDVGTTDGHGLESGVPGAIG